MHLHWFYDVYRPCRVNAYQACRCGERRIKHGDRGRPMDYSWIERGTFRTMPTRGPIGSSSGQARGR